VTSLYVMAICCADPPVTDLVWINWFVWLDTKIQSCYDWDQPRTPRPPPPQSINIPVQFQLTSLPESLGCLRNTTTMLAITFQRITRIPESLSLLSRLTVLSFKYCMYLTMLPESIGDLSALTSLNLIVCRMLTELPESLGKLVSLERLDLESCSALVKLPSSLGQLRSLRVLDLRWCQNLSTLPISFVDLPARFACYATPHTMNKMIFPPPHFLGSTADMRAYLLTHHYPRKILVLILFARGITYLPSELWAFMYEDFMSGIFGAKRPY